MGYKFTEEQLAKARERYNEETERLRLDPNWQPGDCDLGLDFVMATYAPMVWLQYFDEPHEQYWW